MVTELGGGPVVVKVASQHKCLECRLCNVRQGHELLLYAEGQALTGIHVCCCWLCRA